MTALIFAATLTLGVWLGWRRAQPPPVQRPFAERLAEAMRR